MAPAVVFGMLIGALSGRLSEGDEATSIAAIVPAERPRPTGPAGAIEDATSRRDSALYDFVLQPQGERTKTVARELVIAATLQQLIDQGGSFAVMRVGCRSAMCVAEVRWPSYDAAKAEHVSLVEAAFDGLPCKRSIAIPPPEEEPEGEYFASLILRCSA